MKDREDLRQHHRSITRTQVLGLWIQGLLLGFWFPAGVMLVTAIRQGWAAAGVDTFTAAAFMLPIPLVVLRDQLRRLHEEPLRAGTWVLALLLLMSLSLAVPSLLGIGTWFGEAFRNRHPWGLVAGCQWLLLMLVLAGYSLHCLCKFPAWVRLNHSLVESPGLRTQLSGPASDRRPGLWFARRTRLPIALGFLLSVLGTYSLVAGIDLGG